MATFSSPGEYLMVLAESTSLPAGFSLSTTRISFTPTERPTQEPYAMDLSLILAEDPTDSFAFMCTSNRVAGASVQLARRRRDQSLFRGILVNNRIANVAVRQGLSDAEELVSRLGRRLGIPPAQLLSVSTGIIGWRLPVSDIVAAFGPLTDELGGFGPSEIARSIMTTDSYPKCRTVEVGGGRITAIAKGAGMIEPNLATMLVFVLTDLDLDRHVVREALAAAVGRSFNLISVDGDQSTSDLVALMSSRKGPKVSPAEFGDALTGLCQAVAEDIVRNGEGAGHVIRVTVSGAKDQPEAGAFGKAVVNSPLVKTAIYGNDPNVGRILSALGDYAGNAGVDLDTDRLEIRVGEEAVYHDGAFDLNRDREGALSSYLQETAMNPRVKGFPQHDLAVEIDVTMHRGDASATVIGCDLTNEYIRENADYRS
jgi:glutamate N-acetyltransferase / amino-acid N-acetyltransferase